MTLKLSFPPLLTLTLRQNADREFIELLRRIPRVQLITDAAETAVVFDGNAYPVDVEAVERDELAEKGAIFRASEGRKPRLLAVNAVLDDETAARLEDAGIGYMDAGGRIWVPGWKRTRRSQKLRPSAPRALRAPSLRLAQLLADHPDGQWTERRLAAEAGTTQATAHRLLTRLEEGRLVKRHGDGRGASRRVRDADDLRRWLAREGRPGRVVSLSCFVRDPSAIPSSAGDHELVLTGAVAAERIGLPVLTGASRPLVRVGADRESLEAVPEALGGFRTDSGANLTLIADPDRLAMSDARHAEGGGLIAPPSRIMLDLFLESRGEAAAEVFLGLWGSRTVGP